MTAPYQYSFIKIWAILLLSDGDYSFSFVKLHTLSTYSRVNLIKRQPFLKQCIEMVSLLGTSTIGSLSVSGDSCFLDQCCLRPFFCLCISRDSFSGGTKHFKYIHQYMQPSVMHAYGKDEGIDAIVARLNQFF